MIEAQKMKQNINLMKLWEILWNGIQQNWS